MKSKKIYYPIIFIVLIAVFIISILDVIISINTNKKLTNDYFSIYKSSLEADLDAITKKQNSKEVANFIVDKLNNFIEKNNQFTLKNNADGLVISDLNNDQDVGFGYAFGDIKVSNDTNQKINNKVNYVGTNVNNILVYKRGSDPSSKTILLTVSYDKYNKLPSASRYSNVLALLTSIKNIINEETKNNFVFAFLDKSYYDNLGAFSLINQYQSLFNNAIENTVLAVDFDSYGNKDGIFLTQSKFSDRAIKKTLSSFGNAFYDNSVINTKYNSNYNAFSDINNTLQFASLRGRIGYNSIDDNTKNLNKKLINQQYNVISQIINNFSDANIGDGSKEIQYGYFSYLNLFSIYYSNIFNIICLILIIGLMLGAGVLIYKSNNVNGLLNIFKGCCTQFFSLLGALISMFVVYYLFSLFTALCGVITVGSISTLMYSSAPLFAGSVLMGIALYCGFNIIFKKKFNAKAIDVIRGNIAILSIVSIFISIFAPSISYLFSLISIFNLIILNLTLFFKDKFREKFKFDIERLFLYMFPIIILSPILFSSLFNLSLILSTIYYPLIVLLAISYFSGFLPYFSYLEKSLQSVYAKLPAKSIKTVEIVEKDVEDIAKKGKFTKQLVKEIKREKIKREYKSSKGIAVVAFVSLIVLIFSSMSTKYGYNITNKANVQIPTLNYVIDKESSSYSWQIEDGITFKKLKLKGYSFKNNAYMKEDETFFNSLKQQYIADEKIINTTTEGDKKTYSIKPYNIGDNEEERIIKLKFVNSNKISQITFFKGEQEEYVYENVSNLDSIDFVFIGQQNEIKFVIDGTVENSKIEYTQINNYNNNDIFSNDNKSEYNSIETIYQKDIITKIKIMDVASL